VVRLFEPLTARQLGTLQHHLEVESVALSQLSVATKGGGRRLALIDRNRDLYVTPTEGVQEMVKLHTMVDTVAWNEENGSLAAIADGHFVVWYYPECASPEDYPSSHPPLYPLSTPLPLHLPPLPQVCVCGPRFTSFHYAAAADARCGPLLGAARLSRHRTSTPNSHSVFTGGRISP